MKRLAMGFFAILPLLTISSPCLSGSQLTLQEAIQVALQNNPSVQAYEERLQEAGLNIRIAKTVHWGELTGGVAIDRSEDNLMVSPMTAEKSREGMDFDRTRWGGNLTYKLPIYLGGKIPLSIDISKLNELSRLLTLKRLRATVRHNVTELYHAILALGGEEKAVDENLKALHSVLSHTELSIAQGKVPPVDKYKIMYSIRRWEAEKDRIVNQMDALKIALQTLMGIKAVGMDVSLTPIEPPGKIPPLTDDLKTIYERALRARSDLAALKEQVKIASKRMRIAKAARLPSIFAVGAFQTYDAPDTAGTQEWDVSLRMEIPIFDAGRRRTEVEAATAKLLEERMHLFELRQKIIKQVGDAVKRVKTAESQVESFKARVRLGTEVDRVETLKYEKGAGDIDDMLRAKAELAYSNSQFVANLYQWLTAKSYLNLVVEEKVK